MAAAGSHGLPSATLGARVLGIDSLNGAPTRIESVLDHLPVTRVTPRANDATVLVLLPKEEPVLKPRPTLLGRRDTPIDSRSTVAVQSRDAHRRRGYRRQREALPRVLDDHRRVRCKSDGDGRGTQHRVASST